MKKKRNKQSKIKEIVAMGLVLAIFSLTSIQSVQAIINNSLSEQEQEKVEEKVDDLDEEIQDKQEDLESLEQKARNYQRMIDLKKQQQNTLQNQLGLMDVQVESFSNGIDVAKDEIQKNGEEIISLQGEVQKKQAEVDKTKNDLSEMINTYHQIDQELSMQLLTSRGDISVVLNQSEYIDQASQKVEESLKKIEEKKSELASKQDALEKKNADLSNKRLELEERISYLNNEKISKDVLLKETKGEETKYQELLERVEQQKQELIGDIDSLSEDKRGELAKIKSEADSPDNGKASTSWYYSQKDSRWGSNRIGLSSSLIKDYGCALTSVAMVFTFYGEKISPGKMAQQPIFYRDLIVWPQYWKGVSLEGGHAHGNINWSTVDKEIKAGHPVIVFVRARGGKGHYVVIHGKDKKKYVVHDPLFGPNIYLDTTEKLVGAIYNSSTTVDQMIIYNK